jgi:hypothetical protein
MSHYGSADEFVEYFDSRGVELPSSAIDPGSIESALLVASEWLDNVYGPSFSGYKTGGFLQIREWPRQNAYVKDSTPTYLFGINEIPERVIHATYEAALRQLNEPGILVKDYTPNKYKSVSIDGALSVDYANFNQASEIQIQIARIDQLLSPLFNPYYGGSFSNLSGGSSRT